MTECNRQVDDVTTQFALVWTVLMSKRVCLQLLHVLSHCIVLLIMFDPTCNLSLNQIIWLLIKYI